MSANKFSSNPACPAGLRDRDISLVIPAAARLTPEDQSQNESDPKRSQDGLRRVFTNILLCVFLKRPDAFSGVSPRLFCLVACFSECLLGFTAVFARDSACGGSQIFSRFPSVGSAAFQFLLCARRRGRFFLCF